MKKILVIDDEHDIQSLFEQQFEEEITLGSLQFLFAKNAAEAMTILNSDPTSELVILSDINMPGMSGLELLKTIKTTMPGHIVIVITAYGDMRNREKAASLGCDDFIRKPIDFDTLKETLFKYVNTEKQTNK